MLEDELSVNFFKCSSGLFSPESELKLLEFSWELESGWPFELIKKLVVVN